MASRSLPLAIGLTSAAVIGFQLVIMQLLTIAQWHHFAAMVIAIALLGFGAAGTALALARAWLLPRCDRALPLLLLACGASMGGLAWLLRLFGRFDTFLLFLDLRQAGLLLCSSMVCCLPFFFGGLAITLVFSRRVHAIGQLYRANLAGSGLGALLVLGLLRLVDLDALPALLALPVVAAAWLARPPRALLPAPAWLSLAALIPVATGLVWPATIAPSEFKAIHAALQLPGARVIHRESGPYGRLEAVSAPALRFAPSLSLQTAAAPPVRDLLCNNGEVFGTLLGRTPAEEPHILDQTSRALAYAVRQVRSVLVLEAATGNDVSHALHHGVGRIVAVEPNLQATRLLGARHPEWIDHLFQAPGVSLQATTSRAFLRRDGAPFDLIVLPVLGEFGGGAGVQALQPRYQLTLEAFQAMWDRLAADGMISLTLWPDQPPRLTLKAVATLRALLDRAGVADRRDHLLAVRSWGTMTFLVGRSPFTPAEQERARGFCAALGFDPLLLANLRAGERERRNRLADPALFAELDQLLDADPEPLFARSPFLLRPAVDDRPFFHHFLRWRGLDQLRHRFPLRELPYLEVGLVFAVLSFVQIGVAAVLLILLPLVRLGWQGSGRPWTLLYFTGLGLGFMSFEIVLIEKLVLALGHPVPATAAVVAVLLLAAGAGSQLSARLPADRFLLAAIGGVVTLLLLALGALLPPLFALVLGWPLLPRVLAVLLPPALTALLMGTLFPLGLRRLADGRGDHLPWACAIDSCLSVVATALATLVALEAGFTAVLVTAALAYGLAALAALRLGAAR